MEKKDLIKIENAAIRAAGSRMANMFQPRIPTGPGEHEGHKEARRAFYEGFQEGAAYYRLLVSRINDEIANLIEGARLDSGDEEDTNSVMEMCMKNGIPVITAVQTAPRKKEVKKLHEDVKNYIATFPFDPEETKKFTEEHTTESEPEEPSKEDSAVSETMKSCIKATPEQCQACDSNAGCPRSCADIEKNNTTESKYAGNPIEKVGNVLANLGIKCIHEGDERLHYIRFSRSLVAYTVYFQKEDDGNYKVVFSKNYEHGGEVLWDGVISNGLIQMNLELSITEHVKGW